MIRNIQILRAGAALAVVLLHLSYPLVFGIPVGNFGVDVFFVISGFIMAHICSTNPDNFLLRRTIRIVPIYWLLTLGLFAAALLRPELLQATRANLGELMKSLLFIPYQRANGFFPVLVRGWTLNYEVYFYALVSFGLLFSRRNATLIAALMLIMVKVGLDLGHFHGVLAFYDRDIVLEFVLGIAVYEVVARLKNYPLSKGFLWSVSALALLALIGFEREFSITYHRALFLGIPSVLLVASVVLLEDGSIGPFKRAAVVIGDASYMIYLVHPYVMEAAEKVLGKLQISPVHFAGAAAVATAAVVGGLFVHLYIEKPILRVLKNRFAEPKAPEPAKAFAAESA